MGNRFAAHVVLARLVHLQVKIPLLLAFLVPPPQTRTRTRLQALRLALLRAAQAAHTTFQALLHAPLASLVFTLLHPACRHRV